MSLSRTGARGTVVTVAIVLCCLVLVACASGPVRRVSEPAASIQQLTVAADGNWSLQLRINNFSSIQMRFDSISLALEVDGESAGLLQGNPGLGIGPESADVVVVQLTPTAAARIRIADALAERRSVDYSLEGRVDATPENAGRRSFTIERESALSPVPGLPGVLR